MKSKTGAELIADERQRQISKEGWTPEHDDKHDWHELIDAALCYIEHGCEYGHLLHNINKWPWEESSWKPSKDRVRNLVKAGALLAAEIDRAQRQQAANR